MKIADDNEVTNILTGMLNDRNSKIEKLNVFEGDYFTHALTLLSYSQEDKELIRFKYQQNLEKCYKYIEEVSPRTLNILLNNENGFYHIMLYSICKVEQCSQDIQTFSTLKKLLSRAFPLDKKLAKQTGVTTIQFSKELLNKLRKEVKDQSTLKDTLESASGIYEISHLIAIAIISGKLSTISLDFEEKRVLYNLSEEAKEDTEQQQVRNGFLRAIVGIAQTGEEVRVIDPAACHVYHKKEVEDLKKALNLDGVTRNNRILVANLNRLCGQSGTIVKDPDKLAKVQNSSENIEMKLVNEACSQELGTLFINDNTPYSGGVIDNILNNYINLTYADIFKIEDLNTATAFLFLSLQLHKLHDIQTSLIQTTCEEQLYTLQKQQKLINGKMSEANTKIAEAKNIQEQMVTQCKSLEEQVKSLQAQLAESTKQNEKLQRKCNKLEEHQTNFCAQIDTLEQYIADHEQQEQPKVTQQEMIEYINSFTYAYIGGNPAAQSRIRNTLGTSLVMSIEQAISKRDTLASLDVLLVDVSFTGHTAWYKFKNTFGNKHTIYIFDYTNTDRVVEDIYTKLLLYRKESNL